MSPRLNLKVTPTPPEVRGGRASQERWGLANREEDIPRTAVSPQGRMLLGVG